MHEAIFKHYLSESKLNLPFTLVDDVAMAPNYGFYLYTNGDEQYVVAEADSSYASSVAPEIEHLFPVTVVGWRTPKLQQRSMLAADFFKASSTGEYKRITFEHDGHTFSLLSVKPR